ncbi:putative polysaccharide biosynthesis protein [Fusobacterium varium]|nr:putative polysaccharide biosynthesis protein [Fusobacterium varium]
MTLDKNIIKNIAWMIFDKIFILILEFLVGIKVANFYGSFFYGSYSFAVSISIFSAIFFELINSRIIKKYYNKKNYYLIIFNVTFFKRSVAIFLFIIIFIVGNIIQLERSLYIFLLLLFLDNILATSTVGIENYFEFKLQSKKIVVSNNIVKLVSYTLQYIGMILNYPIIIVPIIRCIGSLVRVFILKNIYKKNYYQGKKGKIIQKLIYNMIKKSFYLWLSFISFIIYTQLDKIMLGVLLGKKQVGIYTLGIQLINVLSTLIIPIQVSLFPKMLELYKKNYNEYLEFYLNCNILITQIYIFLILFSIPIVKIIFPYVFISEYSKAVSIYNILIIAVLMKVNGALQSSHMTLKDITKKSFYKTTVGLLLNGILNYILIKKQGIIGAAIATTITQIFTVFIMDFFIKEYKEQAKIQLKSFNPFYLVNLIKVFKWRYKK